MHDAAKLQDRIDALEERLTHQDRTLDELNAVVAAQWRTIDSLTRKLALIEDHVRATASNIADPRTEPPPPHY